PHQGVRLGLAGLNLAAGELPTAGRFGRVGTLAAEHAPVLVDDRRAENDQLRRPFGVHGDPACQTSYRYGVPPCAKSVAMGDMRMWTDGQDEITLGSRG